MVVDQFFDFNIHLYSKDTGDIESQIKSDTELTAKDLCVNFKKNLDHFKSNGVLSGNFHLFNSDIVYDKHLGTFFSEVNSKLPGSLFTILCDFRKIDKLEYLKKIKDLGFHFIKFHSYVQKIHESDYNDVLDCALIAESLKLGICIDTSYGTANMYEYDNLKLTAFLLRKVNITPIILLHSGGSRVLEAMLLADHNKNIYLETSLSIHFYNGSSIKKDFAFAYKKIGLDRVLYASDFPYQRMHDSIKTFDVFCNENQISEKSKRQIQVENITKIKTYLGIE